MVFNMINARIRQDMIDRRSEMDIAKREAATKAIADRVYDCVALDFPKIKEILCFYPLADEVDLRDLYQRLIQEGYILYFPKTYGENMHFFRVKSLDNFERGGFGVMVPKDCSGELMYDDSDKALAIVPGLAFDSKKNRLGFGKGFYDRFFNEYKDNYIVKCGVCFSFQVTDEIEVKPHDVPMDLVITD